MNAKLNILLNSILAALITLVVSVVPVTAQGVAGDQEALGRAVGAETEAEIAAIDLETREVSLLMGVGFMHTIYAPEQVINLADLSTGDHVVSTFTASVATELREPTEAELAEPWKVLVEGAVSSDREVEEVRLVRAVVTIDGMKKDMGVIVVTDSRGMMHFIAELAPESLASVAVGQQAVVVFTESMAITLDKKS